MITGRAVIRYCKWIAICMEQKGFEERGITGGGGGVNVNEL